MGSECRGRRARALMGVLIALTAAICWLAAACGADDEDRPVGPSPVMSTRAPSEKPAPPPGADGTSPATGTPLACPPEFLLEIPDLVGERLDLALKGLRDVQGFANVLYLPVDGREIGEDTRNWIVTEQLGPRPGMLVCPDAAIILGVSKHAE